MIRSATVSDAAEICEIYNYYIKSTTITFEEQEVPIADMQARIEKNTKDLDWLVLVDDGHIVGYAYATKWRERSAYRYSVETSVYVQHGLHGQGYGKRLYQELIQRMKQKGVHALIGGIALPNEKSVGIHEALGFKKIAEFEEVGRKFDRWINVGYWQILIR